MAGSGAVLSGAKTVRWDDSHSTKSSEEKAQVIDVAVKAIEELSLGFVIGIARHHPHEIPALSNRIVREAAVMGFPINPSQSIEDNGAVLVIQMYRLFKAIHSLRKVETADIFCEENRAFLKKLEDPSELRGDESAFEEAFKAVILGDADWLVSRFTKTALSSFQPILLAVRNRSVRSLRVLLDRRFSVDEREEGGMRRTALILAAENGCVQEMEMLREAGARLDQVDTREYTALEAAAKAAQSRSVEKLLPFYAVHDRFLPIVQRAFILAVASKNIECVRQFIEQKIDVNITTSDGVSLLDVAKQTMDRHIVEAIQRAGIKPRAF